MILRVLLRGNEKDTLRQAQAPSFDRRCALFGSAQGACSCKRLERSRRAFIDAQFDADGKSSVKKPGNEEDWEAKAAGLIRIEQQDEKVYTELSTFSIYSSMRRI